METTDLLLSVWGKHQIVDELGPAKFSEVRDAMSAKWKSPGRIAKFITMTRTVFNIAYEDQWIERIPNYGSDFKRPLAKRFKQYKQEGGDKLFTCDEVLLLLNGAAIKGKGGVKTVVKPTTQMKCMIYLGINCGFGNTDVARMPLTACDLKAHMVRFPRPKTGEPRECPLWPETVRAIEDVIAERSETELPNLFLTKYGNPWVMGKTDAIQKPFGQLLKALGIAGRRNIGFYCCRHVFATIGMEVGDRDAVKGLLGHTDPEMVARYNHGQVPLKRRQAVVNHVRLWLFPKSKARKAK